MPDGRMRSVDPARFSMVPRNDVPRSAFDVIHTHKTTFRAGKLIPLYVDEVLPGDSIRVRMLVYGRLATAVVPVMDNLILESFFFYVPCRLVWDNWARFMGEQASPTDTTEFLTPVVTPTAAQVGVGTVYDYMGIVTNGAAVPSVQAMPFRAYNLIFNEFFRDEDLGSKATFVTDDGPDVATYYVVLPRMKRHDYFTSARPWPQKPMNYGQWGTMDGANAPGGTWSSAGWSFSQGAAPVTGIGRTAGGTTAGAGTLLETGNRTVVYDHVYDGSDLGFRGSAANGAPDIKVLVNDIRTAVMIQGFLEKNSRGGTRYTEVVRSHFGVVSPDARLQRPEFLGGGRTYLQMHPINQTAPKADPAQGDTNLGDSGGLGTLSVYNHGFSQSFTEHGFVIGMVEVRADLTYQQGIERMWFRRTVFDHYWPSLAHLGEQAILRREIYATGVAADDNTVFGYQERWSEYKYKSSRTSGYMRSTFANNLDVWHFAEEFSSAPVLNGTFVTDFTDVTLDRNLILEGAYEQQFMVDSMFEVRKVRAMPMFSIPGLGPRL